MIAFLLLTSFTFSPFGFMLGVWADSWEKLQIAPLLVVTPLTSWAQLLFDQHAAAFVACDHVVQPCRLLDQRFR
jgi:hypothetical protein